MWQIEFFLASSLIWHNLLSSNDNSISSRIFKSLATVDVYNVSLVQKCQTLDADNILATCLKSTTDVLTTMKSAKKDIIKSDYDSLFSSATTHPSAKHVATIAKLTSWLRLWDLAQWALDRGVHSTRCLQTLLKALSCRIFENFICPSCRATIPANTLLLDHICQMHSEAVNHMSHQEIIPVRYWQMLTLCFLM